MTATEPSREASPAPSTSSSTSSARPLPPCSAWPPLACLQRRKEKLCHTDLPVRSAPGAWLLVGVGVVLVGMCVAVAGYASAAPKPPQGGRGTSHADRMKLAGPVVMGVGLFIFICSATLLYENRDSALLAPRAGPGDVDPVLGGRRRGRGGRRGGLAAAVLLGRGGRSAAPEVGEGHGKGGGGGGADGQQVGVMVVEVEVEEEGDVGARLLTCVVHHQEPPRPSPSSLPSPSLDSASCNSSEVDFNIRTLLSPPLP
ncbi:hypothetical protein CRUP_034933 [Coryphaenoides rupestris]|nr:hypothetical protein CRUP_034933 [Coryphaenoides rupestris]